MKPLNFADVKKRKKIATLPDHLIIDHILPRLPAKLLTCFKRVCKDWHSAISNPRPEFIVSHMAFSKSSRHQFALLLDDHDVLIKNPMYCILHAGVTYNDIKYTLRMIGCSNGLVGFSAKIRYSVETFFISNPGTGQVVEIPLPGSKNYEDYMNYCVYWFGYVSSVDDYKIVAFNFSEDKFAIYSKKAGKWEETNCNIVNTVAGSIVPGLQPTLINDSLYWPINVSDTHEYGTDIVELNLVRREYEVKPRMNFTYGDYHSWVKLVYLKGCLTLYKTDCNKRLNVWILRQKSDWKSWERVYSKRIRGRLILYSSTGKLLVADLGKLKIVDDLSQLPLEEEKEEDDDSEGKNPYMSLASDCGVADYVDTLISSF